MTFSPLTGTAVQLAVEELNELEHHSGWGRVVRIVEVIARHFADGDVDCLEAQSTRLFSLRRLAAHPGCPLSKSQIQEVLAAFRVYRRESFVRQSSKITPSHAAVVAKLDAEARRELLLEVERNGSSVRVLAKRAREVRRLRGERRGRPAARDVEKAITRFQNGLTSLEEALSLLSSKAASSVENASFSEGHHLLEGPEGRELVELLERLELLSHSAQLCRSVLLSRLELESHSGTRDRTGLVHSNRREAPLSSTRPSVHRASKVSDVAASRVPRTA